MIRWNKYIEWGTFKSTNGVMLPFKWEFDRLNEDKIDKNIILASILSLAHPHEIVGINTVNPKDLENLCRAIYYPVTMMSDGTVKGKYALYDDVVTTGKSMLKAIEHYGKEPEKCICIVDRRFEAIKDISCEGWDLNITSIMDVLDL